MNYRSCHHLNRQLADSREAGGRKGLWHRQTRDSGKTIGKKHPPAIRGKECVEDESFRYLSSKCQAASFGLAAAWLADQLGGKEGMKQTHFRLLRSIASLVFATKLWRLLLCLPHRRHNPLSLTTIFYTNVGRHSLLFHTHRMKVWSRMTFFKGLLHPSKDQYSLFNDDSFN